MIAGLAEPGLVHINDPVTLEQQFQHLGSILLAHHEATDCVALDRHLLCPPIAEVELMLESSLDFRGADIQYSLFVDLLHDLLGTLDGLALPLEALRRPVHFLLDHLSSGLEHLDLSNLLFSFLFIVDKAPDDMLRYFEALSQVLLLYLLLLVEPHNLLSHLGSQVFEVPLLVFTREAMLCLPLSLILTLRKPLYIVRRH